MTRILAVAVLALWSCSVEPSKPLVVNAGGGSEGGGSEGGGVFGGDGGGFTGGGSGEGGGFVTDGGGGSEGGGSCFSGGTDSQPVVGAQLSPPAISGGTLAVMSSGTVVAADPDRDVVWLLKGSVVQHVQLQAGDEPGRVVEGPAGTAFVALRRAGTIAQLDIASGTLLQRLDACTAPRGLAWDGPGQTLHVACADGTLASLLFSGADFQSRTAQFVADDLRDVVIVPSGLLLTTFRQAHVLFLSTAGALTTLTHDDPFVPDPLNGGPDGIDAGAPLGPSPTGPVMATFNRRVAWRMVATSTGSAVIAHQRSQASLVGGDPGFCTGSYGTANNIMPTVNTWLDIVTPQGISDFPNAVQMLSMVLPVDVAVSAGGQLAVVSAGTSNVSVLPANGTFASQTQVQGQPTAVAFSGEDLIVFTREPPMIFVGNGTGIALPGATAKSTGHDIFHTATQNQIACASCHPEAGDDGHVWQLPEGARRTPSLRGGLTGTAPFHWSGNEPDMSALLEDVLSTRMNGPHESSARQEAVLAWLDTQAVLPTPQPADLASVARGADVFNQRCASCHAGAQGTNNTNADVGTGGPFQVPRLHELWYRGPFMHDGRAATLADRFGPNGGSNHADTASLSQAQRDDLLAYLRSR
jgi:mono/diheme cytochrome c family protein